MAAYRAAAGDKHKRGSRSTGSGVMRERCGVRASKLNRQQDSGNQAKSLLGADHLAWKVDRMQGAHEGKPVHDAMGGDVSYAAEVAMEEAMSRMNVEENT